MALSNLLRAYALLVKSRGLETFSYTWYVVVGSLIASRGFPPILPTTMAILSASAIALCVHIYNDITDVDMDKLNPKKKRRPLPSGKVSKREAMSFVYLASFAGITLPLLGACVRALNFETFLLCVAWLALFLAYSKPQIRLKKKFLLKESTPATGHFLSILIGAMAVGSISVTVIFSGIFSALFIFFGVPAFRDTSDIKEDKLYGVKSLATVLQWKQRLEMVILFVLAIMTLTPLTYMNLGLNVIFPIVVVAMGLLVLRFLFPLLNRFEEISYNRSLKFMISYFFSAQIALILGSLPLIF